MERIQRVLVPVDFSDYSRKALNYATDFAASVEAEIFIVYVFRPVFEDIEAGLLSEQVQITGEMQQHARNRLEKLVEEEIAGRVPASIAIRIGRPFLEICRAAEEYEADLIIIATHGHTGVQHLLFGSVAEKVVRKAPCPVLTLREPVRGFRFDT